MDQPCPHDIIHGVLYSMGCMCPIHGVHHGWDAMGRAMDWGVPAPMWHMDPKGHATVPPPRSEPGGDLGNLAAHTAATV